MPTENTHYFYDLSFGAFYADSHYDTHGPTAVLNYQTELTEYRYDMLGGRDGYVRRYDGLADDDDGLAVESYVVLPPHRLGANDLEDGVLLELVATLTQGSGSVGYEVLVAASHEELRRATAFTSGTWSGQGRQYTVRPRARGGAVAVKLSNGEARRWAIDQMQAVSKRAGKTRLL